MRMERERRESYSCMAGRTAGAESWAADADDRATMERREEGREKHLNS